MQVLVECVCSKSLEREYNNNEKKLPETIYHQVDGGPENANNLILGICELLVAKRLVREVVLTRLPAGHPHNDLDGLFGVIWRAV